MGKTVERTLTKEEIQMANKYIVLNLIQNQRNTNQNENHHGKPFFKTVWHYLVMYTIWTNISTPRCVP